MAAKKRHDDHVETVGETNASHCFFSQPANKEGTQYAHQQYTGVFQKNGDRKRSDFAPKENLITLAFGIPGRAGSDLA